jgi:hypothetical protein
MIWRKPPNPLLLARSAAGRGSSHPEFFSNWSAFHHADPSKGLESPSKRPRHLRGDRLGIEGYQVQRILFAEEGNGKLGHAGKIEGAGRRMRIRIYLPGVRPI